MDGVRPEDLKDRVGQEIGTSEWIAVTQDMIDRFADATGDDQFIHVDLERAKQTPFGTTIAHGFLTLSLLPILLMRSDVPKIAGLKMGVNYGVDSLRFLSPVRSGKRVRARFTLAAMDEKRPGQWQQALDISVEIEGEGKPALAVRWINQFFV